MLQGEHSAILVTFIKLPFVIKIFVFFLFLNGRFKQVLLYMFLNWVRIYCSMLIYWVRVNSVQNCSLIEDVLLPSGAGCLVFHLMGESSKFPKS